jgi:hypothetical protein
VPEAGARQARSRPPVRAIADRHAKCAFTWGCYLGDTAVRQRPGFRNGAPHGSEIVYPSIPFEGTRSVFSDSDRDDARKVSGDGPVLRADRDRNRLQADFRKARFERDGRRMEGAGSSAEPELSRLHPAGRSPESASAPLHQLDVQGKTGGPRQYAFAWSSHWRRINHRRGLPRLNWLMERRNTLAVQPARVPSPGRPEQRPDGIRSTWAKIRWFFDTRNCNGAERRCRR